MDWQLAITRNRNALLRIVAALCVMAGLGEGRAVTELPRHLRNHLLRILRPAESAVRRLIVMAAGDLAATSLPPCGGESDFDGLAERQAKAKRQKSQESGVRSVRCSRPIDNDLSIGAPNARSNSGGPKLNPPLSLPLFDPLKRFDARRKTSKTFPRISFIGLTEPCPLPPVLSSNDPVGAEHLCGRLKALQRALDDLDGQAKRYARWKIRKQQNRSGRLSIFRPGWPPGYRKRPVHAVDDVLADCHSLALLALNPPALPPPEAEKKFVAARTATAT